MLRKELNLDKTGRFAFEELKKDWASKEKSWKPETTQDIGEDWLNAFETLARDASSEQLQRHFAKILAGEIRRPGAFSIKTLRVMSQLDANTAYAFSQACSLGIALYSLRTLDDVRVMSLGHNGVVSGEYVGGLSHMQLDMLYEHDLIGSVGETSIIPAPCFLDGSRAAGHLRHQGVDFILGAKYPNLTLTGVALTRVGRELYPIVEQSPVERYTEVLHQRLAEMGAQLIPSSVHSDHFSHPINI
jgi:hypothetical protein